MVFWVASVVGSAVAYLFGSTPTGYLAGKLLKGIDIREHGSKSIGATNVLRTLGKWPALVVLLVDVVKGAAAIAFAGSSRSHGKSGSPAERRPDLERGAAAVKISVRFRAAAAPR